MINILYLENKWRLSTITGLFLSIYIFTFGDWCGDCLSFKRGYVAFKKTVNRTNTARVKQWEALGCIWQTISNQFIMALTKGAFGFEF